MDNKTTPAPKPDDVPKPATPSAPVMDVVAPPPPAPDPAPTANNSDDKPHDPPPAESDHQAESDEKKLEDTKPAEVAPPPKPVVPKQPGSGVGMAIFGTVVIVLALAGLAVYAYLKNKN